MTLFQYRKLEMMSKIKEQDFRSVHGETVRRAIIEMTLVVHAKVKL